MTSSDSIRIYELNSAYSVSAPDCDISFFATAPVALFCPVCDSYLGDGDYAPNLDLRRCAYDFCYTYDGRLLVSRRAKKCLDEQCTTRITYLPVDKSTEYYVCDIESVVVFDTNRRKTRFEKMCTRCGQYESIIGAIPAFVLEADKIQRSGAYRTDICFGSGREKSPVVIIGRQLKLGLQKSFPELDFRPVNESPKQ